MKALPLTKDWHNQPNYLVGAVRPFGGVSTEEDVEIVVAERSPCVILKTVCPDQTLEHFEHLQTHLHHSFIIIAEVCES